MIVHGEEFSQRLETFSDSTMLLIMELQDKETHKEVDKYITDTNYSEQQVVEKLQAIKRQQDTERMKTEIKK